MIKTFRVSNLNGHIDAELEFHPDVNVLTGKNGSGKTTILKLVWYLISGNLERILPEMKFEKCELIHTDFSISMECRNTPVQVARRSKKKKVASSASKNTRRQESRKVKPGETAVTINAKFRDSQLSVSQTCPHSGAYEFLNKLNHTVVRYSKRSLFFPTFRRLEGGFDATPESAFHGSARLAMRHSPQNQVHEALQSLSRLISVGTSESFPYDHRFIASFSVKDLLQLLTTRYTDISQQTNALHASLSSFIESKLEAAGHASSRRSGAGSKKARTSKKGRISKASADHILDQISNRLVSTKAKRDALLDPFTRLSIVCAELFDRGISITDQLVLGKEEPALSAECMSGGEKQMFSFLAYNAFFQGIPIIIDEPELSLHVDWQRRLLPLLLEQESGNQFLIATHSPFIYSKFPEKELMLGGSRGGDAD